jgi:hypothetical protein
LYPRALEVSAYLLRARNEADEEFSKFTLIYDAINLNVSTMPMTSERKSVLQNTWYFDGQQETKQLQYQNILF